MGVYFSTKSWCFVTRSNNWNGKTVGTLIHLKRLADKREDRIHFSIFTKRLSTRSCMHGYFNLMPVDIAVSFDISKDNTALCDRCSMERNQCPLSLWSNRGIASQDSGRFQLRHAIVKQKNWCLSENHFQILYYQSNLYFSLLTILLIALRK